MRWTCPKCGKKLVVSEQQLIARDGLIVCPQCLLQARQPLPKSASETEKPPVYKARKNTTPPERKAGSTPPPYNKSRMKSSITSPYDKDTGTASPAPRRSGKKKSKKKKKGEGLSAWGCLLRTVIFTLVLFAAYVFFGLLLEALQ